MTDIEYKTICKQTEGYDVDHIARIFAQNGLSPHIDYEKYISRKGGTYDLLILKVPRDQYQNAMSIFRKINEQNNKNVEKLTASIGKTVFLFLFFWVIAGGIIYFFIRDINLAVVAPLIIFLVLIYFWSHVKSFKKDKDKNL